EAPQSNNVRSTRKSRQQIQCSSTCPWDALHVRFGSKLDTCSAPAHVRFTPESGHVRCKLECPLWSNSGLMRCNERDRYSITSSARASTDGGIVRPSVLAALRLMINSYLVAC